MSVWVQLYYEGKEKLAGHPIKINPAPKDVADLTKEVKAELPHSLSHCDAANLSVYPPDTDVTIEGYEDKFIKPWEEVPSTDPLPGERTPRPMIAMAPAKADAAIADAADQRFQKVSGTISRPISHGGARFQLFKLACPGGLYPPELDAETAFETVASSQVDRSILRFSVVFTTIVRATKFFSDVEMYLLQNKMDLELLDDQGSKTDHPTVTEIAPFAITFQNSVLLSHYKPQTGEAEPMSPPIDMVVETTRSFEGSVEVTLLSTTDTTFRFQRIETDSSFTLAAPESAHIFPSAQCTGKYRWLDAPEYNRLALSRDVHVNFDGTGRGRGKRRKTVQTFAIKPVRPEGGFTISIIDGCPCFRIPLELEFNNNGIAAGLLPKLGNNAILNKNQGARWTITGADVHVFYPQDHRVTLITEVKDNGDLDLVTAIPGVENLNECWSNSQDDLYSLAAAEILEKCLLWNYRNALEKWRLI